MTAVNLLPPQIREHQQTRRITLAVAAAAGAVVVLLGLVYFLQSSRLSDADRELAAQQGVNAGLQAEIAELQRFAELKAMLSGRQQLVDGALQGQVLWSGVLHDLSMVIPGDMYLTSMTATVSAPVLPAAPAAPAETGATGGEATGGDAAAQATPAPTEGTAPAGSEPTAPADATQPLAGSQLVGLIQFDGVALDHPVIALWLTRLEEVNGWVNAWLTNSTKTNLGGADIVQFSGTIDLSSDATTDRRAL